MPPKPKPSLPKKEKEKRKCQFTDDHQKKYPCFSKGKRAGVDTEGWCVVCENSVSVAFEGAAKMHRVLFIIGALLLIAQVGYCQTGGPGLYSRRYERIDVDAILTSPRLVTNYVECLLNRKPCPPEGKELKRILPEALRTKCSRCWPSQKEGALKVITKLYNDYPKQYSALRQRWDPTGEYHRRFEEYLRDQQFNVIRGSGNDINRGDQSGINSRFGAPERTNVVRSTQRVTSTTEAQSVRSTPVVRSVPTVQTTTTTTTVQATTSRVMDSILTQRPTRQNNNGFAVQRDEQPSAIVTRFDDSPSEPGDSTNQRPTPSSSTQTAPKVTTTTQRPAQMASANVGIGNMDPAYMVTVNTFATRNPILNLINRLSLKFSNTAEFLAGMIRSTVKRI